MNEYQRGYVDGFRDGTRSEAGRGDREAARQKSIPNTQALEETWADYWLGYWHGRYHGRVGEPGAGALERGEIPEKLGEQE